MWNLQCKHAMREELSEEATKTMAKSLRMVWAYDSYPATAAYEATGWAAAATAA